MWPSLQGATNWFSRSYHPGLNMFYVSVREMGRLLLQDRCRVQAGHSVHGRRRAHTSRRSELWRDTRAGRKHRETAVGIPAALASVGGGDGHRRWPSIWRFERRQLLRSCCAHREGDVGMQTGGEIAANPIGFAIDGKEHVASAAGQTLVVVGFNSPCDGCRQLTTYPTARLGILPGSPEGHICYLIHESYAQPQRRRAEGIEAARIGRAFSRATTGCRSGSSNSRPEFWPLLKVNNSSGDLDEATLPKRTSFCGHECHDLRTERLNSRSIRQPVWSNGQPVRSVRQPVRSVRQPVRSVRIEGAVGVDGLFSVRFNRIDFWHYGPDRVGHQH